MAKITKTVTIATAGTPVQLGTEDGNIVEILIQSVKSNSTLGASGADVYIGYADVDASAEAGVYLAPRDAVSEDDDLAGSKLKGRKMSDLYADSTEDNAKVSIVARTTGA